MVGWKMFIEVSQLKEAGFSKSKIARRLNLDRKTVTKYCNMAPHEFANALNQAGNRKRKLDKYEEIIVEWLKEYKDITAAQVEDWLKEQFKDDSIKERTVRSYVAHLRDKHQIPRPLGDSRQYQAVEDPPMGQQMQLDFGETKVAVDTGVLKKLYALGSVLSHSRHKYAEWSETPLKTVDLIAML